MTEKINTRPKRKELIICLALIIVTLAVYWQVNRYDFINYDDDIYVTDNFHVQSGITLEGLRWAFTTSHGQFWHPLTWLSLMSDYQIYGLSAGGFHLTNLILHVLSTLLLFWFFNRITGAIWKSAFVAAFFALHPLRVESVAWISERKDVLSVFFWMLTLCLYVYYTQKPAIRRYLLVVLCFVCGLMSKPIVVTLPVVMILLDYWPLGRFQSQKGNLILWQLREKTLFFILSVIFSIITIYAQPRMHIKDWPLPFETRIINALSSFPIYFGKIFWPQDLTVCYPFTITTPIWQIWGVVLLILVISIFVILTFKRIPYLFVGWFWFSVTLLPVIGIIQVGNNAMADRYMYLPSIGIAMMLAWGLPFLFRSKDIRKKILFPTAIVMIIILSALTWHQSSSWKNSFTLFSHALHVNEHNYQAHINLASHLIKKNKINEAIFYYNKAIEIKPDQADAYNNRGIAYAKIGQYEQAANDFNKATGLQPNNSDIFNNRANFYLNQGDRALGCGNAKTACELGNCTTFIWAKEKGLCN